MPIDQVCECGHAVAMHQRVTYSIFPCTDPSCSCGDMDVPLTDDEVAADIDRLLGDDT